MRFHTPSAPHCPLRSDIRNSIRQDEAALVTTLMGKAELDQSGKDRVSEQALALTQDARTAAQTGSSIQNLLNEYSLSTQEGIVLMCLAEALLRVPDKTTADRLIRDKLLSGDWHSHIGNSDSLFVNSSAWGLLISGQVASFNQEEQNKNISGLKKAIGKIGEPIIRKAMRQAMGIMGTQFVLGRTIEEAGKKAAKEESKGYRYSYDMLGEAARTMSDAQDYFHSYEMAIDHIGQQAQGKGIYRGAGISVKLSALHPRYEVAQHQRVLTELGASLKALALQAKRYDIGLTIDAEECDRLDLSLDIIETVFTDPELEGWEGFGVVVQAYQKRALPTLNFLIELSQRVGRKMMLRLVKGAYWDSEIKQAQVDGLEGYPVFTRKASTDVSYQACAGLLLDNRECIYPQFATHNAYTVAYVLERANGRLEGFEFQRLHGMGEGLYDDIIERLNLPVRIYAPVGEHESLLAYLVRRLLENGANTSFVNNIVDNKVPLSSLVEDPVEKVRRWKAIGNPNIALPHSLYGEQRANARGVDLNHVPYLQTLAQASTSWTPKLSANDEAPNITSVNPANNREVIGTLEKTTIESLPEKLDKASEAFKLWSQESPEHRALCLEKLADQLEQRTEEFMTLCTKEAGKVAADGIAEVREAVDFCRFYANEARRVCGQHSEWGDQGQLVARGVVVCISPWNFPLAIFLGQIAAAIAAGNSVLAKPADSTCVIAARTLELFAECGFPEDLVQLTLCPGSVVGAHLLPQSEVAAVMFTGSTEVGAGIAKTLAQRPGQRIPLIAETGGQNCMLVDSTALPEQVVDDVIASGFQSAGQRCSALRVLFLQEEVADSMIEMIIGAMKELRVGNPEFLHTDVGPVIDQKALKALEEHQVFMEKNGKLLYQCALDDACEHGSYFAPRLYEIDNIAVLEKEVFGPVIHVVRYRAEQLDQAIDAINSTGFGLTSGIHSRIQDTCDRFARKVAAGNIYVNRNTIGAIVGVQPFGGHGLSGTGPKAGGPNYVYRLLQSPTREHIDNDAAHFEFSSSHINRQALSLSTFEFSPLAFELRLEAIKGLSNKLTTQTEFDLPDNFATNMQLMMAQCRQGQQRSSVLPGPTGELNELYLEARGTLLCLQQAHTPPAASLSQVMAALMCGNSVVFVGSIGEALETAIEAAGLGSVFKNLQLSQESELIELLKDPELQGLAISADTHLQAWADRIIREREGALIPMIDEHTGPNALQRFTLEKVVSTDTTASGGNASLLAMGDKD